jgi:hypothetical protein
VTRRARAARSPSPATALPADLAALGPYFAIEAHSPHTVARMPWQPFSPLFGSAEALAARIAGVRAGLAAAADRPPETIEFRVAASVAQLSLAGRLICPALGSAVLRFPLAVDITGARWIPGLGGPFRLSLPQTALGALPPRGRAAGTGTALEPSLRLLAGPIGSLVEMTASLAVPRRVLWGNVASAINGAASMITATRPGLASQAAAVSSALLRFPALAGSHRGQPVTSFRRRSCCLIYRIASNRPAEYCGDCILKRPGPMGPDARARLD